MVNEISAAHIEELVDNITHDYQIEVRVINKNVSAFSQVMLENTKSVWTALF